MCHVNRLNETLGIDWKSNCVWQPSHREGHKSRSLPPHTISMLNAWAGWQYCLLQFSNAVNNISALYIGTQDCGKQGPALFSSGGCRSMPVQLMT